jgi:NitT/TauT family transport system substrate-binding protein
VLNANPDLGRALAGAWYEVMGTMNQRGATADAALERMAKLSGPTVTIAEYKAQLRTTAMFYTSQSAADFTNSAELTTITDKVRQFCFEHGLLGEGAKSVDAVGISFPDGTVLGDKNNIKLRYDSRFMAEHAAGKITLTKGPSCLPGSFSSLRSPDFSCWAIQISSF